MFSALKTQVPQQAKKRLGVHQKACFQGKKKENTYTPKSLQGVCGGPLRAVLVYRFWPPTWVKTGRFWHFFGALFPSTWRTLSPELCLPGFGTHKHPESATLSCFPCKVNLRTFKLDIFENPLRAPPRSSKTTRQPKKNSKKPENADYPQK